jgi:hypothetical protein
MSRNRFESHNADEATLGPSFRSRKARRTQHGQRDAQITKLDWSKTCTFIREREAELSKSIFVTSKRAETF